MLKQQLNIAVHTNRANYLAKAKECHVKLM